MSKQLLVKQDTQLETAVTTPLAAVGKVANDAAARHEVVDFLSRRSDNTLRTHAAALALFADYLDDIGGGLGQDVRRFADDVASWSETKVTPDISAFSGMTWGIVKGYVAWLLEAGYAIRTINVRLSTVKVYCKLAHTSGMIADDQHLRIKNVSGYDQKAGKRVDDRRPVTRVGAKKAKHVTITPEQAMQLKNDHEDTPGGRRDALLMHLLLDLGLRVSEVAGLRVENVDLDAATIRFYRKKVDKWQTHQLINGLLRAMRRYLEIADIDNGRLLLGTTKGGNLTSSPMSERAITKRVKYLAKQLLDIDNMSAHDCRHFWTTDAIRNDSSVMAVRDGGGWKTTAMVDHYAEQAKIANEGIKLSTW